MERLNFCLMLSIQNFANRCTSRQQIPIELLMVCKSKRSSTSYWPIICSAVLLAPGLLTCQETKYKPTRQEVIQAARGTAGAAFIPVDSWIYVAVLRLHDLGYIPTLYVGMRPYTRVSLAHALELSQNDILQDAELYGASDEPVALFDRLHRELAPEFSGDRGKQVVSESVYGRVRGIAGAPLNDSFHVGQTFTNDYGRPYQEGVNAIAGTSGYATAGRFNLYVRGEYHHAPASTGYNFAATTYLKAIDGLTPGVPHFTIPEGPIAATNEVHLVNASASVHLAGHQISFGRSDEWAGPASGGSMAWSNNAEPIYALRINRVEPIYFPVISRLTGAFRYEFLVGPLKGHDTHNAPWIHTEKISFKPHRDLEFGFARSVIWGGEGHVPITVSSFLRSFFSPAGVTAAVKYSRQDPGARFSTFDMSYRIPWKHDLFTVYTDSFVHDNVFPVSNPHRAAVRTGLLISRLPRLPTVDLRAEGAYTDVDASESTKGTFLFWEEMVRNGYTNRSFILGDAIGRENKGGNAWLTWHVSPDQQVQLEYRNNKAAKDFIQGGTTQHDLAVNVRLRGTRSIEVSGSLQGELWRAPLIRTGASHNVSTTLQVTWFPARTR